jgi:hypothetical protein
MTPPVVLTLLAADRVVRHRDTGRYDLIGVFHALNLNLPTYLTFAAYWVLTGCHGAADLDVLFVGPDDLPLGRGPIHVPPAARPLNNIQSSGTFDGARIDRPGTYRLQIACAGEVPAERPILIGPGQ